MRGDWLEESSVYCLVPQKQSRSLSAQRFSRRFPDNKTLEFRAAQSRNNKWIKERQPNSNIRKEAGLTENHPFSREQTVNCLTDTDFAFISSKENESKRRFAELSHKRHLGPLSDPPQLICRLESQVAKYQRLLQEGQKAQETESQRLRQRVRELELLNNRLAVENRRLAAERLGPLFDCGDSSGQTSLRRPNSASYFALREADKSPFLSLKKEIASKPIESLFPFLGAKGGFAGRH